MKPIVTQVFATLLVMAPLACHESSSPQTSEAEIHEAQYGTPEQRKEAIEELDQSAKVLSEIGDDIGKEQRDGAHCVMVIPSMGTGAFIVGGTKGSGVVSCRTANDWSAPTFVKLSGVTFGLQAGGQSQDLVVLANTSDAPGKIFSKNFEFGVGASVAAGPVGAGVQATTSTKADFLSYARTKGAFAGVNLGGVKVKRNDDPIKALYGAGADPIVILAGRVAVPEGAKGFVEQVRMTFPSVR